MTFTQRKNLAEEYSMWVEENEIEECPFSVMSFLDIKGLLHDVSYEEEIRGSLTDHLKKRLYETAINNIRVKCDADRVYADIAEKRLDTWIDDYFREWEA